MRRAIANALSRAPDYTITFDRRMERHREALAHDLRVPVYLDTDMNYSAAQKLTIFFDAQWQPCEKSDARRAFEVYVFISSRGPFFTTCILNRSNRNVWTLYPQATNDDRCVRVVAQIRRSLTSRKLQELTGPVLEDLAPGHLTELDGAPATVLQVLFSELI
jgi:hypothetical protein